MYAVLTGPALWEEIQQVFSELEEEIIYQSVDKELDSDIEFPKVERLSLKVLIIDYSSFSESDKLKQAVMNFKIRRDTTRIIILAPGAVPGDTSMSFFFSLGIYDILNPSAGDVKEALLDCLQRSPSYKKGVKWFTGQVSPALPVAQGGSSGAAKEIEFRDKIIGTVTISFAGSRSGLGCSFLALQAAFYLSYNFRDKKIALVSFCSFRDFLSLAELEGFTGDHFSHKGIDFYNACDVALLINRREYDYIVLDLGVLKKRSGASLELCPYYAEFVRSDVQFLVSSTAPWNVENMLDCLFQDRIAGKNSESASWILLFNFSSEDAFHKLCGLGRDSYLVPYFPYFFKYDESLFRFFSDVLKAVLPQKSSSRKPFLSFLRSK